jgi:uncharacterized protein YjiS (DUF1127 family)
MAARRCVDLFELKEPYMKAANTPGIPACWATDRSFEDFRQHWHQPMPPYESHTRWAIVAAARRDFRRRLRAIGQRVATTLAVWAARKSSRRELAEMSDYELRDVGLTRADVWREVSKPFWRD